jgi:hypothetical protein
LRRVVDLKKMSEQRYMYNISIYTV